MRLLRNLFILIVVALVAVGIYRGWFHFSTDQGEQKSDVTLTIDKEKIRQDAGKAKAKVREFEHKIEDESQHE